MTNQLLGVTTNNGSFKAQIGRKGKIFYLGTFPTKTEAGSYYDRAVLLTSAWTERTSAVNFDNSVAPEPGEQTDYERAMLEHLRHFFPDAEKQELRRKELALETPDVLIGRLEDSRVRAETNALETRQVLDDCERHILSTAQEMTELRNSLKWMREKLTEVELDNKKLRGLRTEDGKSKIVFKPIVHASGSSAAYQAAISGVHQPSVAPGAVVAAPTQPDSPVATVPGVLQTGAASCVTSDDIEDLVDRAAARHGGLPFHGQENEVEDLSPEDETPQIAEDVSSVAYDKAQNEKLDQPSPAAEGVVGVEEGEKPVVWQPEDRPGGEEPSVSDGQDVKNTPETDSPFTRSA